jgi:hypothetical protein
LTLTKQQSVTANRRRARLPRGEETLVEIALTYNVNHMTISRLNTRRAAALDRLAPESGDRKRPIGRERAWSSRRRWLRGQARLNRAETRFAHCCNR